MNKIKVAILFGGQSEEHDVSVKSASEIAASIDTEKYEPIYVGITRTGDWKICEKPSANWEKVDCRSVILSPNKKTRGLLVLQKDKYQLRNVDVIFPVLHGKSGEDGSVQGLLELSGIPYIGCDIQSSAICMDKSLTYVIAGSAGIATPDFIILNNIGKPDADALVYPVFVKPARSGSSFGVTRVSNKNELDTAIQTARQYDSKVLIEQAISGIEIGCAVLGNSPDLTASEIDQITLSHGIFRIHQEAEPEKGSENAVFTVPADICAEKRAEAQETAKVIYKALGCKGLARVDMFLQEDGRIILNEVNTLPGFTSYSRYPRMMSASEIPLSELINKLISLALRGDSYA